MDPMADRRNREALRGAEEETFDILAEVMTSEEWGELLSAPLEHAARLGKRDIAQKLVGAGAEIGDALHAAARGGHVEIVDDLLENGASVAAKDNNGCTPLHVAAQEGTTAMVQLLLLEGADIDGLDTYNQETPLFNAATCDNVGAALALLAAGADVKLQRGNYKESVLHVAAHRGNVDIIMAAIERGADVNTHDEGEGTPLHSAAIGDKVAAIDVLVEAGANIEAQDDEGCTPLHVAARRPAPKAVLALLKHGAHINTRDKRQCTPLHSAAAMARKQVTAEVVDSLLRAGADETILDEEGQAAADRVGVDVAEMYRLGKVIDRVRELLVNAPADRAWRRRGYLLLCRTRPDRVQQIQHISGANAVVAGATRSSAKLGRTETGSCTGTGVGGVADGQNGCHWAVVVARVLGLQEEDIFRTIVGYL